MWVYHDVLVMELGFFRFLGVRFHGSGVSGLGDLGLQVLAHEDLNAVIT